MSSLSVEQLEKDLKRIGLSWRGLAEKLGIGLSTPAAWKYNGRIPTHHIEKILKIVRPKKDLTIEKVEKELANRGFTKVHLSKSLGLSGGCFSVWKAHGRIPEKRKQQILSFLEDNKPQKTIFQHAQEVRKAVKTVKITKDNIDKINLLAIWRKL